MDLSRNTALRSLEVQLPSDASLDFASEIAQPLSSIISPAFSEIVVVFREGICCRPDPWRLAPVLRGLYGIKEFSLAFCLEAPETLRVEKQRTLKASTDRAVAAGLYDFLPCPPLVFSSTITYFRRRCYATYY